MQAWWHWTYLVMIGTNFAANALPLNGRRTGEASDSYLSLFTPAGFTFSVWGVIYLLLGMHVLYQLGLFRGRPDTAADSALLNRVGVLFSISSLANTAWVFAWHYDHRALSGACGGDPGVPCAHRRHTESDGSDRTAACLRWCAVQRVLRLDHRGDGRQHHRVVGEPRLGRVGWPDSVWAVIIVLVAMVIGTVTMLRNRDLAYGLVLIWAYVGILFRQTSADELACRYPAVIAAVIVSLAIYIGAEVTLLVRRRVGRR